MVPPHPLPPKKDVALALLERSSVFIHLDPRVSGVSVPQWFTKQPQLVLQIGLNMAVPIPDLEVDDVGIRCTLSFNRSPFYCAIPWKSVFAMVGDDQRGMVWPDDVPPEVARQTPAPKPEIAKRPQLEDVGGEATRAKRPRKKPQHRPDAKLGVRLTAVPPARPEPEGRRGRSDAERADKAERGERASPRKPQSTTHRKPKRELPPYLRVVK